MPRVIAHFLMFEGSAEEAMNFYVSLFPHSGIKQIDRYGPGEPGAEGSVCRADFALAGHDFICIDSPIKHDFTFTPSMSVYVECDIEAELESAFNQLARDGAILMPPDDYGFSKRFGWVNDRFGLSWQLNLP